MREVRGAGASVLADADTDTLQWYVSGGIRDKGCGARAFRRRRCMMPGQTARQQTADIQRQRSTCRRATSGMLMASARRRTAVVTPDTLTLEL
ncbi:hypothetical protein GCM10010273_32140 [Streptomyces lavendulocolor]